MSDQEFVKNLAPGDIQRINAALRANLRTLPEVPRTSAYPSREFAHLRGTCQSSRALSRTPPELPRSFVRGCVQFRAPCARLCAVSHTLPRLRALFCSTRVHFRAPSTTNLNAHSSPRSAPPSPVFARGPWTAGSRGEVRSVRIRRKGGVCS